MELKISFLLLLTIITAIIIIGCTPNTSESVQSQSYPLENNNIQTQANPKVNNNPIKTNNSRGRNFGNMTDEQRQQMMQQRMQMMELACQDKSEGDSCAMKSQRGDRTGTCKTQNGKLLCSTGRGNFQNRNQNDNPPTN